jgi:hypothetical protein
MSGFDKRDAAYAEARTELMHELLRTGAFDMDEHERGENVARIARGLQEKYPDLDDQMVRRLIGEGMQREYGDATTSEAVRKQRRSA